MIKKIALVVLSLSMALSSLMVSYAGEWTHIQETDYGVYTWDNLWFYIKDSGTYAEDEWINDNGTYYWIEKNGMLPSFAGISSDGYLYNDDGVYVDVTTGERKYLTKEMSAQIKDGMTYDQVVAILGKEHEISDTSQTITSYGTYDYMTLRWFSSDAKGRQYISFKNGVVYYASSDWK